MFLPHRFRANVSPLRKSTGRIGRSFQPELECLEGRLAPAILTVNTTNDQNNFTTDQALSLREAIELVDGTITVPQLTPAAQRQVSGTPHTAGVSDTIQFSITGAILLQNAAGGNLPTITSLVSIQGPGANSLTIDGNSHQFAAFVSAAPNNITWAISGLTVADSNSALVNGFANDILTVQDCTITGNSGTGGLVNDGSATVTNSTITGNTNMGGVSNFAAVPGSLHVEYCTISGNSATGAAGGVSNFNGVSIVDSCTISGNSGTGALGVGGLGQFANGGEILLDYSTISGNMGSLAGGIGAPAFGIVNFENCTIADNSANGASATGGLLFRFTSGPDLVTERNSTISGNSATGAQAAAGGVYVYGGGLTFNLQSTIVSGNTLNGVPNDLARNNTSQVPTINASNNLIQTPPLAGTIDGANVANLIGQNPLLGPLQNNGGFLTGVPGSQTPIQTMALLFGSPALDTGNNSNFLSTDERGPGFNSSFGSLQPEEFVRSFGANTDIGAFEDQPYATTITITSSVNPSMFGQPITFTATAAVIDDGVNGPPTGTVEFLDGSSVLGTSILNNGVCTFRTSTLAVGTHDITVVLVGTSVGNVTFANSTSAVIRQVVNPVPPLAVTDYAVGSDAGTPAEVKVYNAATNALVFDLTPFGNFTGGVTVAVGDLNGDGVPDIIAGAGPGGGPQVVVYDGSSGQMIRSFYGLAQNFTGGIYVAAGDVNGDGLADIIVGAGAGGGSQVAVWSGKDGSLLETFYAFAPRFSGGVRVAAGDVNGDGFADIITAAGPGGGPQVTVFNGVNLVVLLSFNAYAPGFSGGVFVAAGDVNGDGFADIITGPGQGGGPQIAGFSGKDGTVLFSFNDPRFSPNVTEPGASTGVRVGSLTVNGLLEILAAPGPGSPALVDVFNAQNLGLLDEFFAFDQGFLGGVFVGG